MTIYSRLVVYLLKTYKYEQQKGYKKGCKVPESYNKYSVHIFYFNINRPIKTGTMIVLSLKTLGLSDFKTADVYVTA